MDEPEIWWGVDIREVLPISDIPYDFPENWGAKKSSKLKS